MRPAIPFEARRAARSLYWRGWSIAQIKDELGVAYATIASWKKRGAWDEAPSHVKMGDALEARWATLIDKPEKTGKDFKEIDLLARQAERLARIEKFRGGGDEGDLNPNVANRTSPEAKAKAASTRAATGRDNARIPTNCTRPVPNRSRLGISPPADSAAEQIWNKCDGVESVLSPRAG